MAKSTTSGRSRKPAKPSKPYADFPLFPHASGRWAKKIRQKLRFYGRWATVSKGKLVQVEDVEASAASAKIEFDRCWPYHSQGREAPSTAATANSWTMAHLCNAFLTSKVEPLKTGELSRYTFEEYRRACDLLVGYFGGQRLIEDIAPDEFEKFRTDLWKPGQSIVTLKSKLNRIRVVLNYACDHGHPVDYKKKLYLPKAKSLRKAKNAAGANEFKRDDLLKILQALEGLPVAVEGIDDPVRIPASVQMRAMVLLGLNCGFGNTDVASLPKRALDLDAGWVSFPRPKTEIMRRIPLWPETVEALRKSIAMRPAPLDEADADLVFITSRGTRFVRLQKSKKSLALVNPDKPDDESMIKYVTINTLSRRFENVMDAIGIRGRKGLGFYTLRHMFETVAGDSRDQVIVDAIMGHVDESMAAQYREWIANGRLKAVTEYVRRWLFEAPAE